MSKNTKPLNQVFRRTPVMSARPDDTWPSPTELIGVEIEVENVRGNGHYAVLDSGLWVTHHDGSLRNGIEYVFRGPLGGQELTSAINVFFDSGLTYDCTPRTSIHIHINGSDNMGIDDLRSLLLLMYVIEPAVFRWADDNRKHCGYCNPLTDLPPARLLGALFEAGSEADLVNAVNTGSNSDRYYGFNMAALSRHGTLEFRYFPCVTDKQVVIDWIKFVMYAKKAAMDTPDVRTMLKHMQDSDALRQFLTVNFGSVAGQLDRNMDYEDAVGRARHLLAAVKTNPRALQQPSVRATTARSRGFRNFLSRTFPDLSVTTQETAGLSPSDTEQLLFEQMRRYVDESSRAREDGHYDLARLYSNASASAQVRLHEVAESSAIQAGMTLDEYLAAANLNITR